MAATVDQLVAAAGNGNVAEMQRCIGAGVNRDGNHSTWVGTDCSCTCTFENCDDDDVQYTIKCVFELLAIVKMRVLLLLQLLIVVYRDIRLSPLLLAAGMRPQWIICCRCMST
jgi:hypothetical protein